jgi:hypothetical protein
LGCWEVSDLISEIVHQLDPTITTMYESRGRVERSSRHAHGIEDGYHSYGQQLGWHGQFFAAAKLLKTNPVRNDTWGDENEDPWAEWLGRDNLTRKDGRWLSDGTDRTPIDTQTILLEKAKSELVLTGDQQKIQNLVGLSNGGRQGIVIKGDWYSADDIKVEVFSALVEQGSVPKLVRKLLKEEPVSAWLPSYSEGEEESETRRGGDKDGYPWIVSPSRDSRLDKLDPYGVGAANTRPRLAKKYLASQPLTISDDFGRKWVNKKGEIALQAQAWGRSDLENDRGPHPGERLICSAPTLTSILKKHEKTLVLLVKLRRSQQVSRRESSKWTFTVAVISVTQDLVTEYFKGRINHLHKNKW